MYCMDAHDNGSTLGDLLLKEGEEWARFGATTLPPDARLLDVSKYDSNRRLYQSGDRIAKVVRRAAPGQPFGQELSTEYAILQHLRGAVGLNRAPSFHRHENWEVLWSDFVRGHPFREAWSQRRGAGKLVLAWRAVHAVVRLNLAGISHGDLRTRHLIVDARGKVHLIDFGNASVRAPLGAFWTEVTHLVFGRYGSMQRLLKSIFLTVTPRSHGIYKRLKLRSFQVSARQLSHASDRHALQISWSKAASWDTEAGLWHAPWSLTAGGVNLPGRRPWLIFWTRIREAVTFSGKSVLDLNCGMGLLCSFALLEGARACRGVSHDGVLLGAARDIASALGVTPVFEHVELNGAERWEDHLDGADIVVALSPPGERAERERWLAFLLKHKEVLYESREPIENERERLQEAGFSICSVILKTERGYTVIHARRTETQE